MVMESLQRLDPPRALGKWTLLAKLGEGGMASVYVSSVGAGHLQRLAAIKLLRPGAPDHDYRTRFLDEAAVVVRLHHNNIADVREAGEVDGQLFIAMELIEGRDLADVWDRCAEVGRAFPVPMAVYIVREILRGLHYAHTFPGLSLVHRDVSPSNVLIDWAGAVRLADFGLATSTLKAADTVPGMVFGKVGYMAPEQAVRSTLDGRADVYGCGVVLWELLTGRPLRDSGTNTQAVAVWDAPKPSSRSSRVDPTLDAVVSKALARDREDRHASASELLQDLSRWLSEHAPTTSQEAVSEFMLSLFRDSRAADHAAHESLLALARERAAADGADVESTLDMPAPGAPKKATGIAGRISDLESIAAGTVVAERYQIEAPLGAGGMGTVYLAEHVTVGRKVAVKVLTFEYSQHEVVARRFREEARAASAAGHPNIVEVFDAGTLPDGRLYLVMEHLTGHSLYEEIKHKAPFSLVRACGVIRDVARAIRAAHGVGIIHRDLKPDNIMLVRRGEEERVKVLDFGISASADRTEEEARLTLPGHALGTPEYMAPEQARGKPPSERFDIYAMGVILYEMLAGQPPFVSGNIVEVLARKAVEAAPPLSLHRPDVPARLAELCHACLSVDPAGRPATSDDFIRQLDPLLGALLGPGVDATEVLSSTLSGPSSRGEEGTQHLPPPPSLSDFDSALARVDSKAHASSSLVTTPIEFESDAELRGGAPGRKSWWMLAAFGATAAAVGIAAWIVTSNPTEASATKAAAVQGSEPAVQGPPTEAPKPVAPTRVEDVPPVIPGIGSNAGEGSDGKAEPPSLDPEPAPDADPEPEPEPEPDAVPTPLAQPAADATPKPATSPKPDPSSTPRCEKQRADAKSAHDGRKWTEAIALLGERACWGSAERGGRQRMLVKALFETMQFKKCVSAGRGASDSLTKALTDTCKQRADAGG